MLKDITLLVLSVLLLSVFFFASYFIFGGFVKTNDQNVLLLIGTAYGSVSTFAGSVVAYWFGSNKTSADKDKQITTMINNGAKP